MKSSFVNVKLSLTFCAVVLVNVLFAQINTITGIITDSSGEPLPGANVLVQGSDRGTSSDFEGRYSIQASKGQILVFSFVGYSDLSKTVGSQNVIDVQLLGKVFDEIIVTALGISREKKSLGYATQEVKGEDVSTVKVANVVNSLSGKVSGVQIRGNNNFGGSANFLIRGASSLTGNNQPLFVVDGVPISNRINNSRAQRAGGTGYDYGNAASDINPDDIESINILKGSAASAIYGSRGANGVVIISTKSGSAERTKISVNSSVTIGSVDKSTFIRYQKEYGAGYGPLYSGHEGYFENIDVNGDGIGDPVVPTYEDASYGARLDGRLVYQWDAFVPESENYKKPTPYLPAKYTPIDFFETAIQNVNSIDITGGSDNTEFRLGYTNFESKSMLPNSHLNKNIISFNGSQYVNDKLKVGISANTVLQRTLGRNSTGYNDNLMTQFRQWWQVNVDIKQQREIFKRTGKNYSWNHTGSKGGSALVPQYWDNPYWTRFKNFQTDKRNRIYGNAFANYKIADWVSSTFRVSLDTYNELREERRAVGSVANSFGINRSSESSGYERRDISFQEMNYDGMLNFQKDFSEDFNFTGILGMNIRRESYSFLHNSTNGGLGDEGVYSLQNSKLPVPLPVESQSKKQVNGFYAQASIGYKNFLFVDFTDRYDISSALPEKNNKYNYYGISSSVLFSNLLKIDWLNFGKLRLGYAEVGNDLPASNVYDTYDIIDPFGSLIRRSFNSTKKNEDLVPERTKEIEFGLELKTFQNKLGIDVSLYNKKTENQLMAVSTTSSTGFSRKWVNAGVIQNRGVELGLNIVPIQVDNFSWDITINWALNRNKVLDLYQNVENIVIESYQGGITINATKGHPYGTIRGTGFKYDKNNRKVLDTLGGYYIAVPDQVIGNINPDWTGGATSTFKYKNISLSFLIDVQQGGDLYSLDIRYGQGTGLPYYTAGLNELGKPVRDPVSKGGGILLKGVTKQGVENTHRTEASESDGAFNWGTSTKSPGALTVYDASYVKLREVVLAYRFPKRLLRGGLRGATFSLVGRNLWIIDKNVPFADPESGLSAGNAQGYLSGSYPTLRTIGLNVNLEF